MSPDLFSCPMCGHTFNVSSHLACSSCPLNQGCEMVCCPRCGYNSIDARKSKLARLAAGLFALGPTLGRGRRRQLKRAWIRASQDIPVTLADVPPGSRAVVSGFSVDFPAERQAFLQAYGLVPNYKVRVLQHSPVTVIQVDNTELALEDDLARGIQVKLLGSPAD
jgi:Fe2+ transport system protein FeoA